MKKIIAFFVVMCTALLLFASCNSTGEYVLYSEEDLRLDLIGDMSFPYIDASAVQPSDTTGDNWNDFEDDDYVVNPKSYSMKVYGELRLYSSENIHTYSMTLEDGERIVVKLTSRGDWVEVYDTAGSFLGYSNEALSSACLMDCEIYAELPIEYGMAKTNENTTVPAYSHLVDVRKYFKVYSSTDSLVGKADFSQYDIVVAMQLSTEKTTINEPFYNENIALVQYDLIPMIKKAVELFKKDGYTMVICDAYRPTSVQQRWFDVVRVHKWVADPSIGMGGIHDRGTALDITLIDKYGKELEFPTPMHTFTDESSRYSTTMTQAARNNMNYMLSVMTQCGFTYIQSEWWHFQDVDTKYYLPTDHPIDKIPLVPSEVNRVTTIKEN